MLDMFVVGYIYIYIYVYMICDMCIYIWLVVEPYPSEKYEFVSWDDGIPNIWKNKNPVPNHQPDD